MSEGGTYTQYGLARKDGRVDPLPAGTTEESARAEAARIADFAASTPHPERLPQVLVQRTVTITYTPWRKAA